MKLRYQNRFNRALYSILVMIIAIFTSLFTFVAPQAVFATPDDETLDFYYLNGIYYYDPTGTTCDPDSVASATSSKPTGEQITWIGDSYTVGAESIIKKKLTGVDIHAQISKHFQQDVADNPSGMKILADLKAAGKLRDTVVFALGTNDQSDESLGKAIDKIMTEYLTKDQTLILVTPRTKDSAYKIVNEQFEKAAKKYDNIKIADWKKAVKDHLDEYFGSDGIHPNEKGSKVWVDTIYNTLPGGVSEVSGDSNEAKVWNYFANAGIAGVSDNAAVIAGIMGNLKQETSEYNPFLKDGKVYGIYQTDNAYFIRDVEKKFGSSCWNTKHSQEEIDQAIAFELDWLTKKNEYWLGTGEGKLRGFMNHLSVVSQNTPEAYAELFLTTVERAVTSDATSPHTGESNLIKDPGVLSYSTKAFKTNSGAGKFFQETQTRRKYATQIYDKYAKGATKSKKKTSDILNDTDVATLTEQSHHQNRAQIASTTPVKRDVATIVAATDYSSQVSKKITHLDDQRKKFVKDHYQIAQKLSIAYGIPWEAVIAQGIVESTSGTSRLAIDKHNYFGIGAYDKCPYECALSYPNEEEGWKGYYENIRKTDTYRNHGVFSGDTITAPAAYIVAVKAAGYATASDYVSTITSIILGVEEYAQENGWKSSAELAKEHPEMIENAKKYAAGKGSAPTNLSYDANVCIDPSGSGSYADYDGSGFPYYNQADDSTWGLIRWGPGTGKCGTGNNNTTIHASGCGPSSFAMMVTALTGKEITPDMTAKVAGDEGCHTPDGASHDITRVLAEYYGLQYKALDSTSREQAIQRINEALKDGWMIHTSGKGSNPFTSGGHYIGIRGITEDGKWLLADSNGRQGKENTLKRSFTPESVVNAGMWLNNIKAIKAN